MTLPTVLILFAFWSAFDGRQMTSVTTSPTLSKNVRSEASQPEVRSVQSEASWVSIPAGEYTAGTKDEPRSIGHNYEIMKFAVTAARGEATCITSEAGQLDVR